MEFAKQFWFLIAALLCTVAAIVLDIFFVKGRDAVEPSSWWWLVGLVPLNIVALAFIAVIGFFVLLSTTSR